MSIINDNNKNLQSMSKFFDIHIEKPINHSNAWNCIPINLNFHNHSILLGLHCSA